MFELFTFHFTFAIFLLGFFSTHSNYIELFMQEISVLSYLCVLFFAGHFLQGRNWSKKRIGQNHLMITILKLMEHTKKGPYPRKNK